MASITGILALLLAVVCLMKTSALPVKRSAFRRPNAQVERVVLRKGQRLELKCEADAGSPIVFHWLHNGAAISQGPLDHIAENVLSPSLPDSAEGILLMTWGKLVIQQVSEQHGGKYTCVADTGVERKVRSFTVEVTPNEDKIESVQEELRFYQLTYNLGQTEGKPAYFTCRATQGMDKPAPQIKWSLTGNNDGISRILESDVEKGVMIHGNGDLELSQITMDYNVMKSALRCIAYGDNGQVIETDIGDIGLYVFERER